MLCLRLSGRGSGAPGAGQSGQRREPLPPLRDRHQPYAELASRYGIAVVPARVRRPRDQANVETGVQLVERLIRATLRNYPFCSWGEFNTAMATLWEWLNARPFKKLPGCRRQGFDSIIDQPALRPYRPRPMSSSPGRRCVCASTICA